MFEGTFFSFPRINTRIVGKPIFLIRLIAIVNDSKFPEPRILFETIIKHYPLKQFQTMNFFFLKLNTNPSANRLNYSTKILNGILQARFDDHFLSESDRKISLIRQFVSTHIFAIIELFNAFISKKKNKSIWKTT